MLSHSPAPPSTAQGTHSTSAHLGPPLPSLRLKDPLNSAFLDGRVRHRTPACCAANHPRAGAGAAPSA